MYSGSSSILYKRILVVSSKTISKELFKEALDNANILYKCDYFLIWENDPSKDEIKSFTEGFSYKKLEILTDKLSLENVDFVFIFWDSEHEGIKKFIEIAKEKNIETFIRFISEVEDSPVENKLLQSEKRFETRLEEIKNKTLIV